MPLQRFPEFPLNSLFVGEQSAKRRFVCVPVHVKFNADALLVRADRRTDYEAGSPDRKLEPVIFVGAPDFETGAFRFQKFGE